MEINVNKVVSLSYTLEVDGDVIETVNAEKPMMFIFGTGYLLPKFEEYIADHHYLSVVLSFFYRHHC